MGLYRNKGCMMNGWVWLGISLLILWCVVVNMFVMAMYAKKVCEQNPVHWSLKWPMYVGVAIGLVADFLFNFAPATALFLEPPRELLFTSRVTRHLNSSGWRQKKARFWCTQLHYFDHGHCGGWTP